MKLIKFYHITTNTLQGPFKANYQGIHLASTTRICRDLAKNRGWNINEANLYKVIVDIDGLHPLKSNIDTMDWGAKNIAQLLLARYYDLEVSGASEGEEVINGIRSNWKDNIKGRDAFQISNSDIKKLSKENLDDLKYLAKKTTTSEDDLDYLSEMLWNVFHVNCIAYKNYGENSLGEYCLLLFNNAHIKNYKLIPKDEAKELLTEAIKAPKEELVNITERPWTYTDIKYWTNPKDGCCNATIDFDGKKTRLRAGILIIKDDEILLSKEAGQDEELSIPGGGLEENETPVDAAIREAQEEVYINVKNAQETGYDYCLCKDQVEPWVKKNVPEKEQWYNYYTCLVIANYDSEYTGHVDKVDQDKTMDKNSTWYKIKDAVNLPTFKEQWKKALINFGYYTANKYILSESVDDTTESEKIKKILLNNFKVDSFDKQPGSVFIFEDGTIAKADYHLDMIDVLYDEDLISDEDYNYYGSDYVVRETGAIRASYIDENENYIELPYTKMTSEQYATLLDFLDMDQKLYSDIQIATNGYRNRHTIYKYSDYTSDDIIKKIRRYYASGTLYESVTKLNDNKSVATDKTNREFNIWTECEDCYDGQSNYIKIAYTGDNWMDDNDRIIKANLLGYLQYAVVNDVAYIQMIQVKDSEQRKGVATELISSLKQDYSKINWGYTTTDGTKLKAALGESLIDDAIATYGLTSNYKLAGYILQNGQMLDFSAGQGRRVIDHREISDIMNSDKDINDDMMDFIAETHAIRNLPEIPGVCIVYEPTEAQYKAIANILLRTGTDGFTVEIWTPQGYSKADWDYDEIVSRQQVILDIKNYFKTGKIPMAEQLTENYEQSQVSKYILNADKNPNVAAQLNKIIGAIKLPATAEYKIIRDNCLNINRYTKDILEKAGYLVKLVSGYFIVDNLNLVDTEDLETLNVYSKWVQDNKPNIATFVKNNNYLGKELGWFTYIPHWWLEVDGLIVDRAVEMFYPAMDSQITEKNYSYKDYNESLALKEDTRTVMVNKSKTADMYNGDKTRGKNRFERKKYSKIASYVKQYNNIDMNDFFKKDILTVKIPVTGESSSYLVTVKFDGVVAEIAKNIKSNKNQLEFKTILQALTKVFNTTDVFVDCTCPDFKYRYKHQLIINNNSVDGTDKDPGPGKTGMANTQGKGCKHVLLVLNNADWIIKVASVINNYIHYAAEKMKTPFLKLIFPKLYGVPSDAAEEVGLVPEETNLDTTQSIIDLINDYGRNRGKYTKGTNKNPVTGSGGRTKTAEKTN